MCFREQIKIFTEKRLDFFFFKRYIDISVWKTVIVVVPESQEK